MGADVTMLPGAAPAPVAPPARDPVLAADVNGALWKALEQHASKSAGSPDSREAKEYADAAFMIAQTITLLDRSVISPQGVDPETYRKAMGQTLEAQVTPESGRKAKPQQPG